LFIFKRILFVPAYEEMKVDDCSWTSAKSLWSRNRPCSSLNAFVW
jgi:hypothetical protein